jgi:hypothetical protein
MSQFDHVAEEGQSDISHRKFENSSQRWNSFSSSKRKSFSNSANSHSGNHSTSASGIQPFSAQHCRKIYIRAADCAPSGRGLGIQSTSARQHISGKVDTLADILKYLLGVCVITSATLQEHDDEEADHEETDDLTDLEDSGRNSFQQAHVNKRISFNDGGNEEETDTFDEEVGVKYTTADLGVRVLSLDAPSIGNRRKNYSSFSSSTHTASSASAYTSSSASSSHSTSISAHTSSAYVPGQPFSSVGCIDSLVREKKDLPDGQEEPDNLFNRSCSKDKLSPKVQTNIWSFGSPRGMPMSSSIAYLSVSSGEYRSPQVKSKSDSSVPSSRNTGTSAPSGDTGNFDRQRIRSLPVMSSRAQLLQELCGSHQLLTVGTLTDPSVAKGGRASDDCAIDLLTKQLRKQGTILPVSVSTQVAAIAAAKVEPATSAPVTGSTAGKHSSRSVGTERSAFEHIMRLERMLQTYRSTRAESEQTLVVSIQAREQTLEKLNYVHTLKSVCANPPSVPSRTLPSLTGVDQVSPIM